MTAYQINQWFDNFCPEFKLSSNGGTGGWTFEGEYAGKTVKIEFPSLPTSENILLALRGNYMSSNKLTK
jgi:hypothetical protein